MEKIIEIWESLLSYLSGLWEKVTPYIDLAWEKMSPYIIPVWEKISPYIDLAWEKISPFVMMVWEKFQPIYCQFGFVCSEGNLTKVGGAVIAGAVLVIIMLFFGLRILIQNR